MLFAVGFGFIALLGIRFYVFEPLVDSERVTFTANGGLLFKGPSVTRAQLLLPASSDWLDTGVTVAKGDNIDFFASGNVHLAINHVNTSAQDDLPPLFPWIGPDGEQWVDARPRDEARRDLLILHNPSQQKIGQVLGVIIPPNGRIPTILGLNPRPPGVFEIGTGTRKAAEIDGNIWIIVNDLALGPDSRDGYVGPDISNHNPAFLISHYSGFETSDDIDDAIDKRIVREQRWPAVESAEAWNLFIRTILAHIWCRLRSADTNLLRAHRLRDAPHPWY
jgi:hypothetical protein